MEQIDQETDQAFVQLMREHERSVFALAYGKLRNVHDAEDVAQEVFVEAFRNSHKLKDPRKVSGWLFTATTYRCKDHFRKMSRRQRRECIYAGSADSSTQPMLARESDNGVLEAVSLLPQKYRVVVMLRHFAGLSYSEISKATGLSMTTIDSHLRTAKKKLRKMLSEDNEEGDRS